MGLIIAHNYNIDLIVYTAITLSKTIQYLIRKNHRIVQEDGYILPNEREKN